MIQKKGIHQIRRIPFIDIGILRLLNNFFFNGLK